MSNNFYNHSGYPGTRAQGDSSSMRAQLAAIAAGFDKMPALSGNALRLVRVNAGATALESTSSIDGIVIGATTPAAGTFTTLATTGLATFASATVTGTLTASAALNVAGAFAANGGTTLGNAAGDALTVNSSAVTWGNNPTHSGNHTFSGNVTINGNTVIGNASGDAVTFAPSSVTWSNNPTHSGDHTFSGAVSITGTTRIGGAAFGVFGVRDGGAYGGAGANSNVDGFVLESNGNTGFSILTPNTAIGRITLGDTDSNIGAGIVHNHSTDTTSLTAVLSGSASTYMTIVGGTVTVGNAWDFVLSNSSPTSDMSAGYLGSPVVTRDATQAFGLTDAGKTIRKSNTTAYTWTISPDATTDFPIGTVIPLLHDSTAGNITIARGAGVALLNGTTDANQTITAGNSASIQKIAANRWRYRG